MAAGERRLADVSIPCAYILANAIRPSPYRCHGVLGHLVVEEIAKEYPTLRQVDANCSPMFRQQDSSKDLLHSAATDLLFLPIPREERLIFAIQAPSPGLQIERRNKEISTIDAVELKWAMMTRTDSSSTKFRR